MTCPTSTTGTRRRRLSGFVSEFAYALSGLSADRVGLPVRGQTRTTEGHVGSRCPGSWHVLVELRIADAAVRAALLAIREREQANRRRPL
jgi:hypothetical protein